MATPDLPLRVLGVVGAGAMGRGIAQIAVLSGLQVLLYDNNPDAAAGVRGTLSGVFDKLVAKGRLPEAEAQAALARLVPCDSLKEFAVCDAVIEAIVEKLELKCALLQQLEAIVSPHCLLASNTSSLSITALAAACAHPERVAGMHFFNPVPLMKVVEVVDGLRTAPATAEALMLLTQRLGHTPVRAKDMPGFLVNHAGRGMNTEGLRIAGEGVASFAEIDRIMREQAGFKLGPFELLDLTALDVSHPVMESIYHQFYEEPRFRPSPITAVRLAGGLLGRKSGAGFYAYGSDGHAIQPPEPLAPFALPARTWVSRVHAAAHGAVSDLIRSLGGVLDEGEHPAEDALIVVTPFGLDATSTAVGEHLDPARTIAIDALLPFAHGRRRTLMTNPATSHQTREAAHALFAADGTPVTVIRDSAGFVAQRVIATIVNIGCDIAQQRIATPQDIDLAVTLGLGYPMGPLTLGDSVGALQILQILRAMLALTGDPRYRPSPWLARRAQLNLSLTTDET
jgi:3-hydroxybutyryl-CoA dehydrogenase